MTTACTLALLIASVVSTELAHDDGKQDGKRSTAGGGHVVRFERPTDGFTLTGVRIHGSRYGGGYDPTWTLARVRLFDESMRELERAFVPFDAWKVGRAEADRGTGGRVWCSLSRSSARERRSLPRPETEIAAPCTCPVTSTGCRMPSTPRSTARPWWSTPARIGRI